MTELKKIFYTNFFALLLKRSSLKNRCTLFAQRTRFGGGLTNSEGDYVPEVIEGKDHDVVSKLPDEEASMPVLMDIGMGGFCWVVLIVWGWALIAKLIL